MSFRHRHVSHLFGIYPGRQLTQQSTAELFSGAKRALERRGDEGWPGKLASGRVWAMAIMRFSY